jgi:hypothetical protein
MGRVDTAVAQMGVVGEDYHPRHRPQEEGDDHLVLLGTRGWELQHPQQGRSLDKKYFGGRAREMGLYACQYPACFALHRKNRDHGMRRQWGWFESSGDKR